MGTRKAPTGSIKPGARRRGAPTGGALSRRSARPVRPGLADEARRYLAVVDEFRREGVSINWQREPLIRDAGVRGRWPM